MRAHWMLLGTWVLCGACRSQATTDPKPVSSAVSPVAATPPAKPHEKEPSLWVEELTSDEIRAAVASGTTTLIVGTGGIEPNGPHVVTGKHNYVLQTVLPHIARAIGQALIAPVVKFVPEGEIEPQPTGHMQHSGTLSVDPATFEALLSDICRSYEAHGFTDLVLIGDSGGNQAGMQKVAEALNLKWAAKPTRVHYLREYYYEDQWSYDYLKTLGITQIDKTPPAGQAEDRRADRRNGIHDDVYYEAQVAVQDPELIRMGRRLQAGDFSLHGVPLAPIEKTIELGKKLAEYRAGITAKAFEASKLKLRTR
ncbi:MAG TPA: creatininase family protein [Polyangiaceae bacterium]|nr:creatininase family protein [Polyangiaceae bacterium]